MTFSSSRALGLAALALSTTVVLASCSGGGTAAEPSDSTEGQTLTVWFPGNDPAEIAQVEEMIIPAFEEKTGATVEATFVDWGELGTKLSAAFASGTAPDLFGNGPAAAADYAINQRILPLDDYVDEWGADDREDLSAALPGGTVDGVQYLIPLRMDGQLLAYDKADLDAVGIDPETDLGSWESIRDAAEKLTVHDGGAITRSGLLMATDPIGRQQSFATLIAAAGGSQIADDGTVAFDTAEGEAALDFYTGLYTGADAVSTGVGVPYSANAPEQQPLVLDTAAITMLNGNAIQKIATANPDLELGVVAPAGLADGDDAAAFGGAGPGMMINADSKNPDLAWQFIDYLVSPDVNLGYVEVFGGVPVRLSAADSDYVKNNWIIQALVEAAPAFRPNPNVPGWVQARDTMDQYLEQALNAKGSNAEILDQMAVAVDDVLAKSR